MASSDDVPDSTDWLSTPLSGFAAVEAALRCQVCKDFYKTPMITSYQELKLRSNWSMEETVEAFSKARTAALNLARNQGTRSQSPKRKAVEISPDAHESHEPKRLRTSARLSKSRGEQSAVATPIQIDEEQIIPDSNNDDDDEEYVPDAPNGLVPCPSCNKKMKEWQVFGHLESCPGPSAANSSNNTVSSDTTFSFGQSHRRQQKTLERLPPLNYSMLKEQALRKKMSDLGISNQGPRILLERRHKEWLTLWNANCDAAIPKKRSELLHDLEGWERTQGGRAPTTGRAIQTAAVIKDKDFDGAAWAARHDISFKDLIASARKSRLEAKKKTEEAEKVAGDQSQSSASQPPDLMVISSSQPPGGTTTDDPSPQLGEEKSEAAPSVQLLPSSQVYPMSLNSTPPSEATNTRG
ncbi:hypothetical protein TrVFT333_009934 [Trichoderma virens FT-333]|nr:hypothetical protein TrVFT333_009934 [Trichoderma virens FT-333]